MRVVPFDVPRHKRGRGNPELVELLGERCVGIDVNSMKPLDNLCHPVSVIREAEQLTADAFGAAHAFLMVGGTTSRRTGDGAFCRKARRKISPAPQRPPQCDGRHGVGGAVPVYVNPECDERLGIPLGMKLSGGRKKPIEQKSRCQKRCWSTTPPTTASVPTCGALLHWHTAME